MLQYAIERDGLIQGSNFDELDKEHQRTYKKKARDQFLAISFLLGRNRSRYSQLVAELQNSYIMGVDQYPKDIEEATIWWWVIPLLLDKRTQEIKKSNNYAPLEYHFTKHHKRITTTIRTNQRIRRQEQMEKYLKIFNVIPAIWWDITLMNALTKRTKTRTMTKSFIKTASALCNLNSTLHKWMDNWNQSVFC